MTHHGNCEHRSQRPLRLHLATQDKALGLQPLLVVATLTLTMLLRLRWSEQPRAVEEPALAQLKLGPESPDTCSAGVGDTTVMAPQSFTPVALGGKVLALDMPREPLPGQIKPNHGGQCPSSMHAINGGCWMKLDVSIEDCKAECEDRARWSAHLAQPVGPWCR
jgi:hypothetical protein